jgi:drug/metabolite transporter (DMT)-like permease
MTGSNKKTASPFMVILAFATIYIVWGSTYLFILKAIQGFPPFLLGALRFLVAGLLLMGWSMLRDEQIFVKKNIKHAFVSGILLLFIGTGAVIWVEQYLPSGMVAIMVSSSPIWFVLLDKPQWKQNFRSKATIGGLIIGFAGVILLFSEKLITAFSTDGNRAELGGMALLLIGSISWAVGSLYSKYKSTTGSAAVNSSWQMLAAGIVFIPGSLLMGELKDLQWQNISTDAWLSLAYLIFFGSIAGFSAYVWLLRVRPATQVSTVSYVNPVVAVLLGVLFANENISVLQVLGLVTIIVSVILINVAKYRKDNETQKENTQPVSLEHKHVKAFKQATNNRVEDCGA